MKFYILSLFSVKYWRGASQIVNAPGNNLQLWTHFDNYPKVWSTNHIVISCSLFWLWSIIKRKVTKLQNHMWYISERNVVFSFSCNQLSTFEKVAMWRKLKDHKDKSSSKIKAPLAENWSNAWNDANNSHTRFHWSSFVCDCRINPKLITPSATTCQRTAS